MSNGGMPYSDFLNALIDDGEDEVRRVYQRPDQTLKREGALLGFGECRNKSPQQLLELQERARNRCFNASREQDQSYWYWRYRELQIDWVLNVLSAAEYSHGRTPYVNPTARGLQKAISILGG